MKRVLLIKFPSLGVLLHALPALTDASRAHPEVRFDWFQRVQANIDNGKKAAANCQLIFDGDSITDFWPRAAKDIWTKRYAQFNAFDFGISGD